MLVAEEPGPNALDVAQAGVGDALAQRGQHRGRDVDGYHPAHEWRGGQRKPPGPGAEVHHGGVRADTVLTKYGEILGRIGISLLAVEARDERRIEMLRARMRDLVEHPRPCHIPIVAAVSPSACPAARHGVFAGHRPGLPAVTAGTAVVMARTTDADASR